MVKTAPSIPANIPIKPAILYPVISDILTASTPGVDWAIAIPSKNSSWL